MMVEGGMMRKTTSHKGRWAVVAGLVFWGANPVGEAATMQRIEVEGKRVLLGHLRTGLAAELANFDLGPAPQPGHRRILTRKQVEKRLRQAMIPQRVLDRAGLRMPRRVEIVRPKQVLNEVQLQKMVGRVIQSQLPPNASLLGTSVVGGIVLGPGRVRVTAQMPRDLRGGWQSARVKVVAGDGRPRVMPVRFEIEIQQDLREEVRRGARVMVVVKTFG